MSGKGTMKLPDGTTFYGNWKNNDPIGEGDITWTTGEETRGVCPYPDDFLDDTSEASTQGAPDEDDRDFFVGRSNPIVNI